jgi:hypothetical protein
MIILGLIIGTLLILAGVISATETDAEKRYEVDKYLFLVKYR